AYEQKPGQGQLFKNRNRGDNDRAPNLKGTALLQLEDGQTVELDIAAWTKESQKAGKWLSLTVKPKTVRQRFDNASGNRDRFNQFVNQRGTPLDQSAPDDDISFILPCDISPERRWRF